MAVVETRELRKRYKKIEALAGVSVEVKKGEIGFIVVPKSGPPQPVDC